VHEIALSASFYRELDAITDLIRLDRERTGLSSQAARKLGNVRLHHLVAADRLKKITPGAQWDVDWSALTALKHAGHRAGRDWLEGGSLAGLGAEQRSKPASRLGRFAPSQDIPEGSGRA
jgi:hypothetical protein